MRRGVFVSYVMWFRYLDWLVKGFWSGRFALALTLAWSTGGCARPQEAPPLASDVMVDLLVDLHLAHARNRVQPSDSTYDVDSLLSVHGATRQDFEETVGFYARNPDQYVSLLDSVIDRLRVSRPSIVADSEDPLYDRPYGSVFRDTLGDLGE